MSVGLIGILAFYLVKTYGTSGAFGFRYMIPLVPLLLFFSPVMFEGAASGTLRVFNLSYVLLLVLVGLLASAKIRASLLARSLQNA